MFYFLKNFLYRSVLKRPGEKEDDSDEASNHTVLRHRAVDWLYFWLGLSTHLYGATATVLFFLRAGSEWPVLAGLLDAFQEPYLGGLAVYVILKEIEKRRHGRTSQHYGEYFVIAWMGLLFVSTIFILFFAEYHFDAVYKLIITNSLAAVIIYIGGFINRP
ncbi:MAG: hypothetical protein HYW91_01610 [Candidatus Sungbacteria bacterium]|nr:hypothetical protein [Candidatus Sungbacteria bacterium]